MALLSSLPLRLGRLRVSPRRFHPVAGGRPGEVPEEEEVEAAPLDREGLLKEEEVAEVVVAEEEEAGHKLHCHRPSTLG